MMKKILYLGFLFFTLNSFSQTAWATFTIPASRCETTNGTLTANTGTMSASGYTWTSSSSGVFISSPNNSVTPINYSNPGSYTITLTAKSGTSISVYADTVVVNANPVITTTGPTSAICPPPTSMGGLMMTASGAVTYTWMPGGVTGATYWQMQPYSSTNFVVTGTDANGCMGSATQYVSVISGGINISGPTSVCAGTTPCYNVGGTPMVLYSWSGPCGFTGNSPNQCIPMALGCSGKYVVGGNDMTCMWVDTIYITISACTDVNEKENEQAFEFFPNPVNTDLNIVCSSCEGLQTVELTDVFGRMVLQKELNFEPEKNKKINLEELNSGIYFLRTKEGKTPYRKIIKD